MAKDRVTSNIEAKNPSAPPWWLEGSATCGFCYQEFALELEYRCYQCDRPACPFCVVMLHQHGQVVCTGCADPE